MLDQAKMLKQAWDMKRQMDKIQKELARQEIVVQRNGVTITITGAQIIRDIKIDPAAEETRDMHTLEVSLRQVINQAIADSQEMMKKEVSAITGGLNIPGLS